MHVAQVNQVSQVSLINQIGQISQVRSGHWSVRVLHHRAQTAPVMKSLDGIIGFLHALEVVGDVMVDRQLSTHETNGRVRETGKQRSV